MTIFKAFQFELIFQLLGLVLGFLLLLHGLGWGRCLCLWLAGLFLIVALELGVFFGAAFGFALLLAAALALASALALATACT